MRKPLIAGNWKMNTTRAEAVALAKALAEKCPTDGSVEVAVCPPSVYLEAVVAAVKGSPVGVGAQNVYHENNGAFTGELSTAMLADIGCKYVILGHSERRQLMGETDADVNRKLKKVLSSGLIPIVCVGETLAQREAGETTKVVETQFTGSFAEIPASDMAKVVIAYEPVWAIGTGKVATPEQAEEVHAALRGLLQSRYSAEVADVVRIQYGGSVKADNAAELMAKPNIDGALVGGASLKADSFLGIIAGASK